MIRTKILNFPVLVNYTRLLAYTVGRGGHRRQSWRLGWSRPPDFGVGFAGGRGSS